MRKRIKNNYILGACVIIMMTLCILSVSQPIRFQKAMASRETEVKEKLMQIRQAEEKYKAKHGVYTGDFPTLVKGKFLQEDAQYIPYADGKKFTLAATVIVGKSGKQIPVMECGAGYETFLAGLDEGSIQQKIEEANYAGNYPGLKIGDLTTDNNNAGNW